MARRQEEVKSEKDKAIKDRMRIRADATKTKIKKKNESVGKKTLGDITDLAERKAQMEADNASEE